MAGILNALFSGNPFQRATGGDPWEGLREVTPMAQRVPMQPQAQPTSRAQPMPKYNPLFASDGPFSDMGPLGALLAQGPSRQEVLLQQAGMGQQAAVSGIGQRISAGMSPQRALLDFANSPEGQEFFVSGGGFSDLANIVKGVSPAPPVEGVVLGPGAMLANPITGQQMGANPVGEVQKFQAMTDFANMTEAEIAQTARAQMAQDMAGNPTEGEAARAALVASGKISQETSNLIGAGMIKIQPILDQSGATVGHAMVNMVDGTTTMLKPAATAPGQLPQPGSKDYAAGVTPGTETDAIDNNGPTFQGMTNPADIVDSAGPVGWLMEKLGPIAGNAFPAMSPVETTRNRKALGAIMADANMLAKSGKILKTEMDDLRALADTLKVFTDPSSAAQTLISLHDRYTNLELKLNEQANDPKTTAQVRGDAILDLAALKRAKANLPSRESLTAKLEALQAKKPFETLGNQMQEGEKVLEKSGVVEPEKPVAQPGNQQTGKDYTDPNTLRQDWESGKLRAGDIVTLNGVQKKITHDFKRK